MVGKDIEECKGKLKELDSHSLERRAQRRLELPMITVDGRTGFSQRSWDYFTEADSNYIEGHYRSVIFCCASAIDQIFRYEYIKGAKNQEAAIEYLSGNGRRNVTFGAVIHEIKNQIHSFDNLHRIEPFLEKAELLNKIRNKVAVHPLFVDIPQQGNVDRTLKDKWLAKDIRQLINLTDEVMPKQGAKKHILKRKLKVENDSYTFEEIIKNEFKVHGHYISPDGFWGIIQELLRPLAFQSIQFMKEISEGLYPVP